MRRVDETLHNFRMKHPIALIFEIEVVYMYCWQFRSFLEDIEADFTDVLYHTNVSWLNEKSTGASKQRLSCFSI